MCHDVDIVVGLASVLPKHCQCCPLRLDQDCATPPSSKLGSGDSMVCILVYIRNGSHVVVIEGPIRDYQTRYLPFPLHNLSRLSLKPLLSSNLLINLWHSPNFISLPQRYTTVHHPSHARHHRRRRTGWSRRSSCSPSTV